MSAITIAGDTSGSITLDAPAVSGTTVLTLPATTGTVFVGGQALTATTGSFSGNLSFNSGYGSAAVAYGCRAWVNFGGTGTVTLRASGNVTSITDNGTGTYTINFTTSMPDANYAFSMACNGNGTDYRTFMAMFDGTKTVSSFRIILNNPSNVTVDVSDIALAFFR
jgi:hypothetical protein